ncbi:MAG: alanine racemase [Halanaerobiales bacterium]
MSGYTRPVWVEIDIDNLKYNYGELKARLSPDTLIMAVVKADAYGHGVIPVAEVLLDERVDRLGVALPEEGVELREAGFDLPVHVLGEVLPGQYELIMEYDLIPTVARIDSLDTLNKLALERNIIKKIHIKIDTGMGRIGILPDQAVAFVQKAWKMDNIEVEGLMTHFATADEKDKEYTYQQWERFNYVVRELEEKNIFIDIKHAGNSATIIDLADFQLNMIRPGISLYGLLPSLEVEDPDLKPVLSWKARIDFLKEVPAGTAISYGATYVTERKSKIATIPLGYADGYSRFLSNKGYVIINGNRAPIRGRVCMDSFMVDVTDIPGVTVGDEVVLIGKQGNEGITATEMAEMIGTINYEVLCNISNRVPRKFIK